ncbi:hypothetical protein SDC9_110554 [bioreactor metagenome]|uniref:Uncharacterized protein n=1 Tax=bioreactor metagenome TaxID=1076179 RepID=A0A645BKC8_9ZZZZ|nr:hypothetical protein [Oscillospiraceae bacterium]
MKISEIAKRIVKTAAGLSAIAVICFALLFFIVKYEIFTLPDFIKEIFVKTPETVPKSEPDEEDIFTVLKSPDAYCDKYTFTELTIKAARSLLSSISEPATFYRESQVTLRDGADEMTSLCKIYKDKEKFKLYISGEDERTVIHSGGKTYIWTSLTGKSVVYNSDSFSYCEETGICDISYFLSEGDNALSEIRLAQTNYGSYLYISFTYEPLNQREEYIISLDYGIVDRAYCYESDKLVYTMKTDKFTPVESLDLDAQAFEIPISK